MDNSSISSKQIIYNLIRLKKTLIQNLGHEETYKALIEAICTWEPTNDKNSPSLKELVALSGLSYDRVRNQLQQMYRKLVDMTEEEHFFFTIAEVEYVFYVDTDKNSLSFRLKSLPVVPRVGEQISIPFFSAYLDSYDFYVEYVKHDMEEDRQVVSIILKQGLFNPYWYFRKAQAWEEGEIDYNDLKNLNEYQLKGKLNLKKYSFWRKDSY
ncbi:hypothetical protein [Mongoliitalea lutea]|nr:hypothetical protein [Mongoliitalea lutea]